LKGGVQPDEKVDKKKKRGILAPQTDRKETKRKDFSPGNAPGICRPEREASLKGWSKRKPEEKKKKCVFGRAGKGFLRKALSSSRGVGKITDQKWGKRTQMGESCRDRP